MMFVILCRKILQAVVFLTGCGACLFKLFTGDWIGAGVVFIIGLIVANAVGPTLEDAEAFSEFIRQRYPQ